MNSATRTATKFSFVLPTSFDPGEFLTSPGLRDRFDDARYVVSLILTKLARKDVDEFGLVRLMAKYLRSVMRKSTCAAVLDALRNGGAIERYPYAVGKQAFGYRLAQRFVADKHVRLPATNARLIRRLEQFHQKTVSERESRMQPVHRELARRQEWLEIDGDSARRILDNLPSKCNPFDVQGVQIGNIENHEFHSNVGKYGRLSNNITNLKREIRPCLRANGERLVSIDLSCAQPALVVKVMNKGRETQRNTEEEGRQQGRIKSKGKYDGHFGIDFALYNCLVQSGTFYDFMIDQLVDHGISRDMFKRRFLQDVIAKKGQYPSVVTNSFCNLFPSVHRFIRDINKSDHATLIRQLQQAESEFIIGTVANDFMSRFPTQFVISLHDALYTTPHNLPALEQSFHRAFKQIGFRMRLKIDA